MAHVIKLDTKHKCIHITVDEYQLYNIFHTFQWSKRGRWMNRIYIYCFVEIIYFYDLQISLHTQVDVYLMLINITPYRKSTQF